MAFASLVSASCNSSRSSPSSASNMISAKFDEVLTKSCPIFEKGVIFPVRIRNSRWLSPGIRLFPASCWLASPVSVSSMCLLSIRRWICSRSVLSSLIRSCAPAISARNLFLMPEPPGCRRRCSSLRIEARCRLLDRSVRMHQECPDTDGTVLFLL